MRLSLIIAGVALASALPDGAVAQYVDGALIIYGNDKCPTNKEGQEITVCARRPEGERYRIPKELRQGGKFAESESWTRRADTTLNTGRTGADSCSAVGPGGFTGCAVQNFSAWKQDKKEAKAADQAVP